MFGQKPQLPVDLLLGQAEEEQTATTLEDWVTRHQDHLASVYVNARRYLEAAATSREHRQPEPNAPILLAGTLVYKKNYGPGRRKSKTCGNQRSTKWWNAWIRLAQYTRFSPVTTQTSRRTSTAQN
ncbi:hypothetical protein AAFF_G00263890 [Aldrovandia affinis]|uniref:Uncharacterized protein n=1 Tax=Aldrovandia affinis TaxID=143900 RepID=A0AAD7WSU2_9TELE|nr:hypothetical protein AAFF_G00263890 [Aldrovandia affinis]